MIIFLLILTPFIFGGSWGSIENWLEPKTKPPSGNLASMKCSAPVWNLNIQRIAKRL